VRHELDTLQHGSGYHLISMPKIKRDPVCALLKKSTDLNAPQIGRCLLLVSVLATLVEMPRATALFMSMVRTRASFNQTVGAAFSLEYDVNSGSSNGGYGR
jgi:hypothetical protein